MGVWWASETRRVWVLRAARCTLSRHALRADLSRFADEV
jgi:hypothetical protein